MPFYTYMCIDSAFTLVLNTIHLMSENIDDSSHTDVEMVLLNGPFPDYNIAISLFARQHMLLM